MNKGKNFHKNNLGLKSWISGGKYTYERYAYTLHRITGLGILFYFILHIFVTGSRLGGPESWENTMAAFSTPIAKFGEFLIFLAFAYHALNGLRLAIIELGFGLGKPARPIFPYKTAIHRQRPLFIVIMIFAAIFMVAGGLDFYFLK